MRFFSLFLVFTFVLEIMAPTLVQAQRSSGGEDCVNCSSGRRSTPRPNTALQLCENMMARERSCEDIPVNKRIRCSEVVNPNMLIVTAQQLSGCAVGALRAVGDFLKFVFDVAKFLLETVVRGVVAGGRTAVAAINDPSGFARRVGMGAQRLTRAHILGVNNLAAYVKREYLVSVARVGPTAAMADMSARIFGPIMKTVMAAVGGFIENQVHKFNCYNESSKNEMICRAVGQFLIPPAGIVALLRGGGTAVLRQFPNIQRGISAISRTVAADRRIGAAAGITVRNAPEVRAPRTQAPRRGQAPRAEAPRRSAGPTAAQVRAAEATRAANASEAVTTAELNRMSLAVGDDVSSAVVAQVDEVIPPVTSIIPESAIPTQSVHVENIVALRTQNLSPEFLDILTTNPALAQVVKENPAGLRMLALTVEEQAALAQKLKSNPQLKDNFYEIMVATRHMDEIPVPKRAEFNAAMRRYFENKTRDSCPL